MEFEYELSEKKDKMEISAGLLIIWGGKVLLVHGAKNDFRNGFTPPKGGVDKGEKLLDAAIRETEEEVGIKVPIYLIDRNPIEVNYMNNSTNTIRKKVYLFKVEIDSLDEIGMKYHTLGRADLPRPKEIDYAKFYGKRDFPTFAVKHYHIPEIQNLLKDGKLLPKY